MRVCRIGAICLAIAGLIGCATSHHEFSAPTAAWQTRSGQLLYRNRNTTLIGDVLVRSSANGDFELTFSKGPSLTLLTLRQDATSAEVKGAMAGPGWSGPIDHAPRQLRGWLGLRDKITQAGTRQSIQHTFETESFKLHF